MAFSLYLHIPFCVRKCAYCDFVSFTNYSGIIDNYIDSLIKQMTLERSAYAHLEGISTLYLGGGTPTLLSPLQAEKIIAAAERIFGIENGAEISIEVNPGTVNRDKFDGYKKVGINRISTGVQSFNDTILKYLGRIHTSKEAVTALESAKSAGFENIGVDLIYAVPGQSFTDWEKTLSKAISISPKHISAYSLTVEENTPLYHRLAATPSEIPDNDSAAAMLEMSIQLCEGAGFHRYEISNFAVNGFDSRHNLAYWDRKEYLGCGVSAHSLIYENLWGTRWSATTELNYFIKGDFRHSDEVELSASEAASEFMFLGLRKSAGVDAETFRSMFGGNIQELFPDSRKHFESGALKLSQGACSIAPEFINSSNQILLSFV